MGKKSAILLIKVKENDFKKNQNIYSVKEEKNTSVKIWKKKFFEQDCEVRLSKAYWGQKKIWLHFLFSHCDLTEKKIAPFFKSVARILIHKNSALKEIAIKLYDSVHGQMSNMKANLLVDLWHYHYFIQTFVFDKNIV